MSMKKQSGEASKYTILEVEEEKSGVSLSFGKEKLLISFSSYASGYYYPGKELEEKEYQTLKEQSSLKKAEDYLSSLLKRNRYTVNGAKEKLEKRFSLPEKEISLLIKPYQEAGILDDLSYAVDFASSKAEMGYGKRYIEAELKKRKIDPKVLKNEDVLEQYNKSLEVLPLLIDKKNNTLKNLPLTKRKENLYAFLLRRGFEESLVKKEIHDYYQNLTPEEKEEESRNKALLLKKEAAKCYNALAYRNEMDGEKKKKLFFSRLMRKGFTYHEIDAWMNQEGLKFK